MSETLWITIPTNEENELKNIISSISSKNLSNLSIDQLVKKLQNNQAADWIAVLAQYNAIPSVNNINTSEMLNRAKSVRNKFAERGFPDLQVRQFEPRELLSLVILCYSNPTLIGRNLCTALNDNNNENVKKEMIQFSAYRKSEDRVLPSQSNLRLLGTAIYFNDTNISLPQSVIDRVTRETIRDGRIVRKLDQRGGFEEVINGPARASVQENAHRKRDVPEIDSHAVFQSLQSGESSREVFVPSNIGDASSSASPISYGNQSELTPQVLSLNATNNAANTNNLHGNVLLGAWFFSCVAKPAYDYVGSFFSKAEHIEQPEKEAALLSPTAKP
ncbi:hypothetical protein [Rickettsiella endosymbiont of Rhagonycha lignosa]|uniref:hypothetical protein n=1 Tax=Rickettsiella endosymbiont of Rhagonycha lignosa TaxID=3077937 RepID=UPI00313AFDCB